MMNAEVNIDSSTAMRQAGMTAHDYFTAACRILEDSGRKFTTRDAVELTKVMAQDFHTALISMKLQEIRDRIEYKENDD